MRSKKFSTVILQNDGFYKNEALARTAVFIINLYIVSNHGFLMAVFPAWITKCHFLQNKMATCKAQNGGDHGTIVHDDYWHPTQLLVKWHASPTDVLKNG